MIVDTSKRLIPRERPPTYQIRIRNFHRPMSRDPGIRVHTPEIKRHLRTVAEKVPQPMVHLDTKIHPQSKKADYLMIKEL